MVLDTDAWNEIDDQFALVHVLLAPDRARLEAVYAAPFVNSRAATPAEGMGKSEAEIHRVGRGAGTSAGPQDTGVRWVGPLADRGRRPGDQPGGG